MSGENDVARFLVSGTLFEVDARYTPDKPIGKGAYGVVCSATDTRSGVRVAIKRVGAAFDNADAKRVLREVALLRRLRHENVVRLRAVAAPPPPSPFDEVYLVYDLMDTDLHQVIRSPQPLTEEHCRFFMYQLLRGLLYIHSAGVIHRDIKPSNLLVNANCDLRICDFGLARPVCERELTTEYAVTRWYRAPELLLSCADYDPKIDLWSAGCVLAEMLGRRPLAPGRDYLNAICRVTGTPCEAEVACVASPKARHYLRSLPPLARADLGRLFPAAPAPALALLATLLAFSPRSRPGAADALAHPWLAPLRDARDEPVFGGGGGGAAPLELPQLAADGGAGLDADALRALVRQEAALFGDG